jgi:hypothetical protein
VPETELLLSVLLPVKSDFEGAGMRKFGLLIPCKRMEATELTVTGLE